MEYSFLPLSNLDQAGLVRLTRLHNAVMHTLLTDLGPPLVLRYYEKARTNTQVLGLYAPGQDGEIAGWAMGSPDPQKLNASLRKPLGWFAGQMLRLVFTRPGVMIDLLRSLLTSSDANNLKPGQVELTYIGVAARARGQGLGAQLLNAFCDSARQAGYQSVVLSVEDDNLAALALYGRAGFKVTHTFKEGRFSRQRLELLLQNDQ